MAVFGGPLGKNSSFDKHLIIVSSILNQNLSIKCTLKRWSFLEYSTNMSNSVAHLKFSKRKRAGDEGSKFGHFRHFETFFRAKGLIKTHFFS